jgi:crotonobetainyl-CoA:carnitine CoA-transferase CaiB-like acyl-CoA transferase
MNSTMTGPLQGIRVLDLSRILAGPWATQTLADFGADVIKIEKPGEGDDTRGWGPPFVTNGDGTRGDAAYFHSANRGKHSVCIDMSTPEGQSLIKDLAAQSDVVVENFKVGGLHKYGLDYESLKAINAKLVYCSITGFGQTGPYAHRAGYDFMIQGMSGVMSITGEQDGGPVKMGVAFSDIFAGLHAVIGIQAALLHRTTTGEGQHIDISLLDSQVAVLANQALNYLVGGKVPARLGNAHPNIVPYQTFETADGYIIVAVGNDRQFAQYCRILGVAALAEDPRFVKNEGRVENRDSLIPLLLAPMKQKSTQAWIEAFEQSGVPCGPINSIDKVFANEQVLARGLRIDLSRESGATIPGVVNPIRFSKSKQTYGKPSPELGNATRQVLKTVLHLDDDRLNELAKRKVIG